LQMGYLYGIQDIPVSKRVYFDIIGYDARHPTVVAAVITQNGVPARWQWGAAGIEQKISGGILIYVLNVQISQCFHAICRLAGQKESISRTVADVWWRDWLINYINKSGMT